MAGFSPPRRPSAPFCPPPRRRPPHRRPPYPPRRRPPHRRRTPPVCGSSSIYQAASRKRSRHTCPRRRTPNSATSAISDLGEYQRN